MWFEKEKGEERKIKIKKERKKERRKKEKLWWRRKQTEFFKKMKERLKGNIAMERNIEKKIEWKEKNSLTEKTNQIEKKS